MTIEVGRSVVFPDDQDLVIFPDGTTVKRIENSFVITLPETKKLAGGVDFDNPKPVRAEVLLALKPLIVQVLNEDDSDYYSDLCNEAPVLPGGEDSPDRNYEVACEDLLGNNWHPKLASRRLLDTKDERLSVARAFGQIDETTLDIHVKNLALKVSEFYPEGWDSN